MSTDRFPTLAAIVAAINRGGTMSPRVTEPLEGVRLEGWTPQVVRPSEIVLTKGDLCILARYTYKGSLRVFGATRQWEAGSYCVIALGPRTEVAIEAKSRFGRSDRLTVDGLATVYKEVL